MSDNDAVITYESLYELLRLEKYRKELQKLDGTFFENVVNYLEEKKAILHAQETKDNLFAQENLEKTKKQVENIQKILKELYEKRESKIVQLALFCSRTKSRLHDESVLLGEEKVMYHALLERLNNFRKTIQDELVQGRRPRLEEPKGIKTDQKDPPKSRTVRFLQAVPEFVGEDMNTYGPFVPEDIANLPVKVSEVLIKNNRATEL
ncbi:MAG TPA: hypothetical protein VFE88_02255 [Candidatus Nanoarchaeia archaeon]|nr:hypothetical protein [Candidatus Nanoarchaeia archaeon]